MTVHTKQSLRLKMKQRKAETEVKPTVKKKAVVKKK